MSNWVMAGNRAINMNQVTNILFPEERVALVFFASLEARTCEECERPTNALDQAWIAVEGEGADDLRRYIRGVATDTRTPVPPAFQEG